MKKQDFIFILGVAVLLLPFFICRPVYEWYHAFNAAHGMIMSFLKFAVLSTLGEMIGLRISAGVYCRKGFGVLPRMFVWGILGMGINMAMVIFSNGTPAFLQYLGMQEAPAVFHAPGLCWAKVGVAFAVSVSMNTIFAPVFMTLHKNYGYPYSDARRYTPWFLHTTGYGRDHEQFELEGVVGICL